MEEPNMQPNNAANNVLGASGGSKGTVDIGALQAQSAQSFGQLNDLMGQNGFIFNPTTGTFVQNPNFLNPLQYQQATGTSPAQTSQTAGNAAASEQGTFAAKQGEPMSPADLSTTVNSATGNPAPNSLTPQQFQQGGYSALNSTNQASLPYVKQSTQIIGQLQGALAGKEVKTGTSLNDRAGIANSGIGKTLGLNNIVINDKEATFAQNLSDLDSSYKDLVASKRISPNDSAVADLQLPTLADNPDRFQEKLLNVQKAITSLSGLPDATANAVQGAGASGGKPSLESLFGGG